MGETDSTRLGRREESRSETGSGAHHRAGWIIAVSVLITFLASYFREFVRLDVPTMSWGDYGLFADHGARILAGQMPYRDYFTFLTPGTDLVYSLLFRWLGAELRIPNLTMACLAAIACQPADCRAHAESFTWAQCARQFRDTLRQIPRSAWQPLKRRVVPNAAS